MAPRKRGQWKELPSATELRDRKASALYRQAALAFHEKGYAATSIGDIAQRLGVSKATLYHYVGNKQELLFECHMAACAATDEALSYTPDEGVSGLDQLHIALRCYLQAVLGEDSSSVVTLEEAALEPEHLKVVLRWRDQFQAVFESFVRAGVADGSIIPCDVKLATFGVLGGINWVDKWHRSNGAWKPNQIAAAMSDLMVRSLATKPKPELRSVGEYPDISAQDELQLQPHRRPVAAAAAD